MAGEIKLTPETLVDRHDEREVFRSMFEPESTVRIMQLAVPSGGGKSDLLQVFTQYCLRGEVRAWAVLVDFKENRNEALTALDVAAGIHADLRRYRPKAFSTFVRCHEAFRVRNRAVLWPDQPLQINTPITISDLHDSHGIGVQVKNPKIDRREPFDPEESAAATDRCLTAFVEDLTDLLATTDVVILFDTWEKCPQEVQDWVRRALVCDCIGSAAAGPGTARLRLVVAGRPRAAKVPRGLDQHERLDWGLMTREDYLSTVTVRTELSKFDDEHVRKFIGLYGVDESHSQFSKIYSYVRDFAGMGNLKLADMITDQLRSSA